MTNQLSKKATVFFLILMLGLAPAFSYARGNDREDKQGKGERQLAQNSLSRHDDDEDENDDDDDDRDENRLERAERKEQRHQNKLCRKAFKNLFKSGNLGSNSADFYIECLKPFGFETRFIGPPSSTTTPDTTSPIITNLSVTPATTTATITWHTNEKSDSAVFWGTSAGINVNSSSTPSATDSDKVKNHEIVIGNLTASTTYFLIVRSRDASSNTGTSSEISFHTNSPIPVPPDTTPPVISAVATQASSSSIQVSWNTNEPATSKIYYGTSTDLDINATSTSFMENLTLTLNHLISLVSLLPQTVYHLIIRSVDGSGNSVTTPLITATTTAI